MDINSTDFTLNSLSLIVEKWDANDTDSAD